MRKHLRPTLQTWVHQPRLLTCPMIQLHHRRDFFGSAIQDCLRYLHSRQLCWRCFCTWIPTQACDSLALISRSRNSCWRPFYDLCALFSWISTEIVTSSWPRLSWKFWVICFAGVNVGYPAASQKLYGKPLRRKISKGRKVLIGFLCSIHFFQCYMIVDFHMYIPSFYLNLILYYAISGFFDKWSNYNVTWNLVVLG